MEYKVILCGKGFYQEIELKKTIKIGTTKDCEIRFNQSRVSEAFQILIEKINDRWIFRCEDGVTFKKDNPEAGEFFKPEPGERMTVYSNATDKELFFIDFYEDYELKTKDYDLKINFGSCKTFTMGGGQSSIIIEDTCIERSILTLRCEGDSLILDTRQCQSGISVNGIPVSENEVIVRQGDFFALRGYQFFLHKYELYTAKDSPIVTRLPISTVEYQQNHYQYPKFVKSVRQQYIMPNDNVEILYPKQAPEQDKKNLIMSLMPMILSLVIMVALRGTMGGNMSMVILSASTVSIGIVTTIITFFSELKKYKKAVEQRETIYREYLAEQEKKIVDLREREYAIACRKNPSIQENVEQVSQFSSRLFEKQKEHDDYLVMYLGEGIVKSTCQVSYKEQEYVETEDFLFDYPRSISEKYKYIQNMPVVVDLKSINAVGYVGNRNKLYQMAKNAIINIATQHFYDDVKFFYLIDKEDVSYFTWTRWLQNSHLGSGVMRNYCYDDKSEKIILEFLYTELSRRDALAKDARKQLSNFVIFAYRSDLIRNHPIIEYVKKAQSLGFTFVFFEEYEEYLNDFCDKRIFLSAEENKGRLQDVHDGDFIQEFEYEHIPGDIAEQLALKLGCTYVDEVSLEENLTKSITLYELLDVMSADDLEISKRWEESEIYKSMAAPLGVKTGGEKVYLDLHEKFHGPHGLVAGTTGSGKSEILQSYILSMATLFHPYEVGFIIIDFKGGGMVNQFRELPHLNGAITNIDGREIDRSLLSIRAELKKRQEYFAEYQVNHINDYIKLYKKGETKKPLPHLILIVDEFAELKSDQPEFMKELISAARIGRSLGVHLILATQKPSGVVNEQIWSNSKFKLCLKVQNKQDSEEVLKSPLAAEIREPGRAYLQVGNNEIFQLFQSAYSGAPANVDTLGNQKKFVIAKVNLVGQREIIYEKKAAKQEAAETQLSAVVKHIAKHCVMNNIERLPNICLPPLEELIEYSSEGYNDESTDIKVPIGIYDDPSRQRQSVTGVNLTESHLFILGATQYGKTNLIQTLIKGIAEKYSPEDVNIYIIDFASMVLRNFEGLVHVGGVVTAQDDEKMKNFMKMMEQTIAARKEILSKKGLSSYAAYREAGYTDMPQIVLFLDGYAAFKEMCVAYEEAFLAMARDGISVGLSMVVTNIQTSGMGMRFLSYFATKIGFTCNNTSEYGSLFDRCKISPKEVPGRCIILLDKELFECQTYLAFEGEKEIERVQHMKKFILDRNQQYKDYLRAKRIPVIPDIVTDQDINERIAKPKGKYEVPVGLDFATTDAVLLDLSKFVQIGLTGRGQFGRSNLMRYWLGRLQESISDAPFALYMIDDLERKFSYVEQFDFCKEYSIEANQAINVITTVHQELEARYQLLATGNTEELDKLPLLMVVLNNRDSYTAISSERSCVEMYKAILGKYKMLKVVIILSNVENVAIGFSANEVMKQFKDNRILFAFEDLAEQKIVEVSMQIQRENKKRIVAGEAFMFINSDLMKIKTPLYSK